VNYRHLGKAAAAAPATESRTRASGILQVPMTAQVTALDPAWNQTVEDDEVRSCVFETLMRVVGEARVVPWLASSFSIEESGKKIRFQLRPDVRFHDGRRLTARDVRFTFERILLNPTPSRTYLSPMRGAQDLLDGKAGDLSGFRIHSATEFTIELDNPLSFFPVMLSFGPTAILPEGTDRIGKSWKDGAVGTGPFRVVEFEAGRRATLERNPAYWREGLPAAQGVVFSFGVSPEEILEGFRAGRFSIAGDLRPSDVEALRREPDFAAGYHEAPYLSTYFAAFNARQGCLENRALRRKLVGALNVPQIVRQALGHLAIPAHGIIPPGLLGYEATPPAPAWQAAGGEGAKVSPELELTAAVHPVYTTEYAALFQKLTEAFRNAGVKIRPVTKTMDDYLKAEKESNVDLFVARWAADYADADTFANTLHSDGGFLRSYSGSPEIDRLIERGRTEGDPEVREECLLVPLFHEQIYRFARPEIQNLTVSYQSPTVPYEKLEVTASPAKGGRR
jgi:ABC-type transport system substrate-binding protein